MEPGGTGMFGAMFTVVPVLIGLGFVFIVGTIVYRSVRMVNRGQNPLTIQEDLAQQVSRSSVLSAPRSKQERLDELQHLHALGRISDGELAEARARILAE